MHASRPLVALLIATVLLFALWLIALKPSGSGNGAKSSSNQGLGQYQADINAAHRAVTTAGAAGARAGADPAPAAGTPTPTVQARARGARATSTATRATSTATRATDVGVPAKSASGARSAVSRLSAVEHALRSHKVLALLFYNPAAPDDRAVQQELAGVPTHGARVFKLAIPLNEIGSYMAITSGVPVNLSPTLVLVAPDGQADEIVGYADPFEISQRLDDALAIHP
jgi:hypothetical protein